MKKGIKNGDYKQYIAILDKKKSYFENKKNIISIKLN